MRYRVLWFTCAGVEVEAEFCVEEVRVGVVLGGFNRYFSI
jgi:hypothetical protein